ncbi:MAG: LysR family transcriptional regulator [Alphaproteobacteria bacterium]
MLTLKQIEALYWINALGSFAAAARKLNMTQSALSKRIGELEATLGTLLFDRSRHTPRLTAEGQALIPMSEEMLALESRMMRASGRADLRAVRFRFGITELAALSFLPRLVAGIRKAYPKIILEPEVDASLTLFERLAERRIDLAIGPWMESNTEFAGFTLARLGRCAFSWVASPSLHLGDGEHPLAEIERHPILVDSDRSASQKIVFRWMRRNGLALNWVISCNSLAVRTELAAAGFGVTFLPQSYCAPYVRAGRLVSIETVPPLPAILYVAAFRSDDISPLSAAIARIAKARCTF